MAESKDKQSEIYEFLKTYTESKGYPPSVREICEAVSLKSTSTVHGHLKRLEKKGLIKRDPSKPRALEIAELSVPKTEARARHIVVIPTISAAIPSPGTGTKLPPATAAAWEWMIAWHLISSDSVIINLPLSTLTYQYYFLYF